MTKFILSSVLVVAASALTLQAHAADAPAAATQQKTSLEDQLKALDAGNQAPAEVSKEKLYAVQTRYLPLYHKSEFMVGGASNLTPDSFLTTQQFEVGYRFHFNDRWSMGVDYAWVDNKFKSEVGNIRTVDGAVPDVPYAISRADLLVEFNAFYGKFRWSADTVSYFDQYWAVGPGQVQQNTGTTTAGIVEGGFAFWLGQWGSARLGLKDYVYNEQYQSGTTLANNLHAHLDLGYLF